MATVIALDLARLEPRRLGLVEDVRGMRRSSSGSAARSGGDAAPLWLAGREAPEARRTWPSFEYGCSIERHDDGPHVLDRRGRRILDAPSPSRPLDLGWETILARNAELQITAATNAPLWDGARIDDGAVIDALLGVDRTEAIRGWS